MAARQAFPGKFAGGGGCRPAPRRPGSNHMSVRHERPRPAAGGAPVSCPRAS